MGGSSSQVVGYRYYAKFAAFIGNRIEKLIAINFDNRKWVVHDPLKHPINLLPVLEGDLFGENEGGVSGNIDIHFGYPDPWPNAEYQKYIPLVSGYPYQSYLVFREITSTNLLTGKQITAPGFYLGNSGYMKEMLLWVKRTRVRNDGRRQWYEVRGDGAIVCEIDAYKPSAVDQTPRIDDEFLEAKITSSFAGSPAEIFTHIVPVENNALVLEFSTGTAGGELPDDIYSYCIQEITSLVTGKVDYWEFSGYISYAGRVSLSVGYSVISRSHGDGITTDQISGYTDSVNQQIQISAIGYEESEGRHVHTVFGELTLRPKLISAIEIEYKDINPIHKIREILTDDTAMAKPEVDVNNANFIKAADRIYDERLGVSWAIDEKSCIEAIEELCYHIEAGIRVNRQTGLYEMVLFRDDWFEENEIHDIAESKIKDLSLEVMNSDDIVNQLNVTYYDRERIKSSTFSVYENGSILTMGHANAESVEFPYFMNMRNAEIVANWKLKQFSTPAWSGSFTTGWREARKWNRYDLIRLAWSKKWNGTILVRIMKINLGNGTDNTVTIDFEEVIPYSGEMNTSIVVDAPVDAGPQPPLACPYEPFEMPYYLAVMALGQRQVDEELSYENNFGLAAVVAEKPQSNSLYAVMMTHSGIEGEEWVRAATINYEPAADLDQIISRASISFTVKDSAEIAGLPIGTLIKCGSDWIGTPGEWMVFQGIDAYTGVVSVKRGALDSLPQAWGVNTKLYFCGNDVAFDASEYIAGEEILVSALTTTPSGMLENKGSIAIEMNARAFRPYPPANVKINGNYFPETHVISSDILLTWAHRNRVQQTGGEIMGWYEGSVTLENGVTYSLELSTVQDGVIYNASDISLDSHTIPSSVLLQNKAHKLKLWSVRQGFKSYQAFEHSFFVEAASLILTATANKNSVTGNTVPAANILVNVDSSLSANMQFDGSSIKGKAPAGSVITIEVEE